MNGNEFLTILTIVIGAIVTLLAVVFPRDILKKILMLLGVILFVLFVWRVIYILKNGSELGLTPSTPFTSSQPTIPKAPPRRMPGVVTKDDFSTNRLDWDNVNDSDLFAGLRDDKYIIDFSRSRWEYIVVAPGYTEWSNAPLLEEPYEYSFEISNASTTSPDYSIAVLFDVGPHYESYKKFYLRNDGTYELYWWKSRPLLLIEGVLEGSQINFLDGRIHTVRLRVEDESYTVFIDDDIKARTDRFGPIYGTIGFGLSRDVESNSRFYVEFDNLSIQTLTSQ